MALALPALLVVASLLATDATLAQERTGGERPGAGDTTFLADGDTVPFRHSEHTDQECVDCHSTEDAHGTVTVTSIRGCRSCHHEGSTAEPCTRCHDRSELEGAGAYPLSRDLSMSVDTVRGRELPFDHAAHDTVACATCHTDGSKLSAAGVECAECHDEHHGPEVDCAACHREASEETHPLAVHASCTGSGCHDAAALPVTAASMDRSPRNVCLSCHQDLADHRPGERCARCHLMPAAEGGDRP